MRMGMVPAMTDDRDRAAVLLAAAAEGVTHGVKVADLRALPEVQAIVGAIEPVRRACILLAAAHDDQRVQRLLPVIARKRAGLSPEDVEAILPPVVPQDPAGMDYPPDIEAGERLRPLIGQIEATWAGLDPEGQRRLEPRLRELADWIFEVNVEKRLRALIDPRPVPSFDMISDDDQVGPALRTVLEASPEPLKSRLALVGLLAEFPQSNGVGWTNPRTRPLKKWYVAARSVADDMGDPGTLAGALLDAAIPVLEHRPGPVGRVNEAILCGLALFAGQVVATADSESGLLPRLRRLALVSARRTRLANVSAEAIANAAPAAPETT